MMVAFDGDEGGGKGRELTKLNEVFVPATHCDTKAPIMAQVRDTHVPYLLQAAGTVQFNEECYP